MLTTNLSLATKIRNKVQDKNFAKNFFVFVALLMPIICFLIFFVYIHIDSFLLAFRTDSDLSLFDNPQETLNDFTIDTLARVFKDFFTGGTLAKALLNTVIYFFSGLCISMPISLLMSYFIYKKIRFYKFFRVITYIPALITSTALIALFISSINTGGPIHYLHKLINGTSFKSLIGSNDAMTVTGLMVFYGISFGFGGNIIIFCGAMNSIDKQILEAGEIDGANWFRELCSIIIPTIWPTISTMLILSVAGIFTASGPLLAFEPSLSISTDKITTLSFELYRYVKGGLGVPIDLCYSSAIGLVMTLITFPLVLIIRKILNRGE